MPSGRQLLSRCFADHQQPIVARWPDPARWQEATQKAKFELANGCHHFRNMGLRSCHIIGGSSSPNPSMF